MKLLLDENIPRQLKQDILDHPKRLLAIKPGNIKNRDLIRLFEKNIERIQC